MADLIDYLEVVSWDSDFIWKISKNIDPAQETPALTFKISRSFKACIEGLYPIGQQRAK